MEISKLVFSLDAVRVIQGRVSSERAPLYAINTQKHTLVPDVVPISPSPKSNVCFTIFFGIEINNPAEC